MSRFLPKLQLREFEIVLMVNTLCCILSHVVTTEIRKLSVNDFFMCVCVSVNKIICVR